MKKKNIFKLIALFISSFMIVALGTTPKFNNEKEKDVIEVNADAVTPIDYEQFEEPDRVSVYDLYGAYKMPLDGVTTRHKYNKTATNGSVVLSFELDNKKWDKDAHFQIYLELDEPTYTESVWWNSGNYFWFQSGATYMMQQKADGTRFNHGTAAISASNHTIEVGRIAIKEEDQSFAGRYYCFIKVDGELWDNCINTYDPSTTVGEIHITGRTECINRLIDTNWTGNEITFMANKAQYGEKLFTKQEHISAPAVNPSCEGKQFIGWFDELGNKWDFTNDEVVKDLTLTAGFTSQETGGMSDEQYFSDANFTPVLRFIASSDNHVSDAGANTGRLASVFEQTYEYAATSSYTGVDAALFAGDLSDKGSETALNLWKTTVNNSVQEGTKVVVSMGNHEFRTYDSVSREVKLFEDVMGQKCDYHTTIGSGENIYHVIALSPNLNEGYNFTASKVAWLEEQLAIAAADTPDKPIFVIQHEHIKGTVYGSTSWGMDELTEVLCKYPQVVDFSGHSHYPLADARSIWQGTFTALGTGTLHYYEMGINGYKNCGVFPSNKTGGWSSSSTSTSQTAEYLICELDENNAMRVIVWDALNDREITRYCMRNLMDERKVTYSHFQRSADAEKPHFEVGTTLNATADQNTINLEWNQAVCADTVESYRIELYKGSELVQTEYALSDYFFYPMPSKISYSIPYLDADADYYIKVYAVNVWNQECDEPITASCHTGELIVYEDKIQQISLYDLRPAGSSSKYLTTDTLNSYKPVEFTVNEDNPYGSFELTMQFLYMGADFQILFDEEFENRDLMWYQTTTGCWFILDNWKSTNANAYGDKGYLEPGLYTITAKRWHETRDNVGYTYFQVIIVDSNDEVRCDHTTESTAPFTTNGKFAINFNSGYAAGSRFYDIDETITRYDTPTFKAGADIELSTPIENWSTLGGALVFESTSPTLTVCLEDANGQLTNEMTVSGKFTLGKNGDYYKYEIKTNKFTLGSGVDGTEKLTKFNFVEDNWEIANLEIVRYKEEKLDDYDEISMFDIALPGDTNGLYWDSPVETGLAYAGTSPSYSAVLKYYLVVDELNSKSEFRSQLGTLWSYFCFMWIQEGQSTTAYFGTYYSTRPADKYTIPIKEHSIYLFETGTIRVVEGEWAGWNYTYFKIDDVLITGFYVPANECKSTSYQAAFQIEAGGYTAADISLKRDIQYIVDGQVKSTAVAINGCKFYEPEAPVVSGKYFTGWYTKPNGGERVDFNQKFYSEDLVAKYYARFADTQYEVKFVSEGEDYATQMVGEGGQALRPEVPTKEGTYKYTFVGWYIDGTDTEYDFASSVTGNVNLVARFEEYQYRIVYKVDGKDTYTKYYIESNPTVIIGDEPTVPEYKGSTGYWDYAISNNDRTKGDTYAIARYNADATLTESTNISLIKFNGAEVDIANELTRFYLSFADTDKQGEWLESYLVNGGNEYQDIQFAWTDSENTSYIVYFADNAAFNNAFAVRTNKTMLSNVGIFTPGVTYYWKVVGEQTNTVSAVDTVKILNTPVRWISADTVYNVRDIGGWTTTDGKQVKYGVIYRGGQLSIDQSFEKSYMTAYSKKVFDYLGINLEIELRGESTHTINQINEFEEMIHVNGQVYTQIFKLDDKTKKTYIDLLAFLANGLENGDKFYFHCSWGADRTGFVGFMINSLLGVPYEQLVQDFELTSLSYSGRRCREATGFDKMYNQLLADYGETEGEKTIKYAMENFLVSNVGVNPAHIATLRAYMLEEAVDPAVTYEVTYIVEGKEYLKANIFAGGKVATVAPVYFEKHFDHWELDGQVYDLDTPVTKDMTLVAVYAETKYEDYDVITVRDLGIEDWTPCISEPFRYEGYAANGSRMFVFDYEIVSEKGVFDDGVHVELAPYMWQWKAHVWIAGAESSHVFVGGDGNPTVSSNYYFKYGETYRIKIGVVVPEEGEDAGKKMLYFIVGYTNPNTEIYEETIICQVECYTDLASSLTVGMAGTQGILHSVDNLREVKLVNGETVVTQQVTRGAYATAIEDPITTEENKKFLGWYDSLGNKWDFENDKVLKDITLTARFGAATTEALVLDDKGYEIVSGCEVVVGSKVSELIVPQVGDKFEFIGWFEGETKLSDDAIIVQDMNLICKFKVKEVPVVDPEDPEEPEDPEDPEEPIEGCKGAAIPSLIGFVTLLGLLLVRKNKRGC